MTNNSCTVRTGHTIQRNTTLNKNNKSNKNSNNNNDDNIKNCNDNHVNYINNTQPSYRTTIHHNNNTNNNTDNNNTNTNSDYCYALVAKAVEINLILNEPEIDLWRLRELALTEGGLVNDALRRRAWPKLVGLHTEIWDTATTQTVDKSNHEKQKQQTQQTQQQNEVEDDLHHPNVTTRNVLDGNVIASTTSTASTTGTITTNNNINCDATRNNNDNNINNNDASHNGILSGTNSGLATSLKQQQQHKKRPIKVSNTSTKKVNRDSSRRHRTCDSRSSLELIDENTTDGNCTHDTTDEQIDEGINGTSITSLTPITALNDDDKKKMNTKSNGSNGGGGVCGDDQSCGNNSLNSNQSLRDTVIAKSADYIQIELDCKRCTWHLLTGSQRSQQIQMQHKRRSDVAKLIRRKQRRLSNLINYTLIKSYSINNYTTSNRMNSNGTLMPTTNFSSWAYRSTNTYMTFNFATKGLENTSNTRYARPNKYIPKRADELSSRLAYYQGYHDVACIVLSTLSGSIPIRSVRPPQKRTHDESYNYQVNSTETIHTPSSSTSTSSTDAVADQLARSAGIDIAAAVLYQLSQSHLVDCMKTSFMDLQTTLRLTMFPLLAFFDPEVHRHFLDCDMELPFFALSWVITWFSHEIRDTQLVKRLFDCFIVSHPLMPIYLSVAMILHPINRREMLDTEYDFSSLHQTLSSLPRNSSMVGWQYRPEDGYISDDGNFRRGTCKDNYEDDDSDEDITNTDDSISIDTDSFVYHPLMFQSYLLTHIRVSRLTTTIPPRQT